MMNGLGYCAPCTQQQMRGLGAIVMQPLAGAGLGQGTEELALQFGAAGPLALMAGAGLSYGTVSGLAGGSLRSAGTGAILGAGLVGVLAGGSMSAGIGVESQSEETRQATLSAGLPAALVGAGLLVWGGIRVLRG